MTWFFSIPVSLSDKNGEAFVHIGSKNTSASVSYKHSNRFCHLLMIWL